MRRQNGFVIETERESVKAGRWWWYDDKQNPLVLALRRLELADQRVLARSIICLREAHRLHRQELRQER